MTYQILQGDTRAILPTLPDQSVQCVVTSPPYFGLRDYGMPEQLGLEPSPQEFVDAMVTVFREVRRVLKDDGTLWLNLGDSYAGAGYSNHDINGQQWKDTMNGDKRNSRQAEQRKALQTVGIKPKDLIGIPWRVAFALQADGWYLRQDIIWHKPNTMPESVKDRCTKAHEYVFLLSKSSKYLFNADAIAEPLAASSISRLSQNIAGQRGTTRTNGGQKTNGNLKAQGNLHTGLRNKRSVWTISPRPFKGAHFATFPIELPTLCIKAGSNKGDTVLDPFNGAATTGIAAQNTGRNYLGIELNPEYVKLAQTRLDENAARLMPTLDL